MAGSYEEVNYTIRPAKQIERKMICEAIRRLAEFASVASYRYIGFGSIYFSDFALFHRQLNISNMISIEKDEDRRERFEFNKPFDCIEVRYGHSNQVLPKCDWAPRTILWLDYDSQLSAEVLADISSFCASAASGSLLIVTVNAHIPAGDANRVAILKNRVGIDKVPINLDERDLKGWKAAATYRRIMSNVIGDRIKERNGNLSRWARMRWQQVFGFEYADGARMTTLGGVLFEEGQKPHFDKCAFGDLEYSRLNTDACRINVPALTYRELRHLDRQLPNANQEPLDAKGVPAKDLKAFESVYRYYPTFAEADL